MTWADSVAARAVTDGLLARRKLDGDVTVMAPENRDVLQAIISQGKRAEGTLRASGTQNALYQLRRAYESGGMPYVE